MGFVPLLPGSGIHAVHGGQGDVDRALPDCRDGSANGLFVATVAPRVARTPPLSAITSPAWLATQTFFAICRPLVLPVATSTIR
jgi:hypothetical protein